MKTKTVLRLGLWLAGGGLLLLAYSNIISPAHVSFLSGLGAGISLSGVALLIRLGVAHRKDIAAELF